MNPSVRPDLHPFIFEKTSGSFHRFHRIRNSERNKCKCRPDLHKTPSVFEEKIPDPSTDLTGSETLKETNVSVDRIYIRLRPFLRKKNPDPSKDMTGSETVDETNVSVDRF